MIQGHPRIETSLVARLTVAEPLSIQYLWVSDGRRAVRRVSEYRRCARCDRPACRSLPCWDGVVSCLALPLPFELRCGTRIRGARGRRIGQAEWDQLIGPWGRQLWEAVVRSVEGSSRVGPWPPYA